MKSIIDATMAGTLDAPEVHQTREEVLSHIPTDGTRKDNGQDVVVFKLANFKGKGNVYVDGIDDVINPKSITTENPGGKLERIRLISGVPSIWSSDQEKISEEYFKKNRRSLLFEGKFCRIPKWDTQAIDFARNCRHCIGNPSYRTGSHLEFFEWNPAKQAEEALKKRQLRIQAMIKANEVPVEEMRKHALYLGVQFADEVGFPKTDDAIRIEYVMKAEDNAKLFMDSLIDPIVTISYMVKKAIRDSKIDLGRQPGTVYWATGQIIAHIPKSRKEVEYLIELANTNSEEGKTFLEQLQTVVK